MRGLAHRALYGAVRDFRRRPPRRRAELSGEDSPLGRPVRIALTSQLIMGTTGFMAMPLLSVYLTRELRLDPVQVSTTLTVLLASSRVMPIVTGALADRFGYRGMMSAGVALRSLGCAGLALVTEPAAITGMALLIGTGGALYEPAVNGALATQPARLRPRIFAIHNQVLNASVVVGPALGAAALGLGVCAPFLVAAGCFAGLAVVLHRAGPVIGVPRVRTGGVWAQYRLPLRNQPFLAFCVVMVLWWILFTQLSVALPIRIADSGGGERWVSLLFFVNGAAGLVSYLLVRRLLSTMSPAHLLVAGYLVTGAGLALGALFPNVWWILGCVALYTLGETLLLPASDVVVAGYANGQTAATFFGLYALSWALGGSIGNYLGLWLATDAGPVAPCLLYSAIAVVGALAMRRVRLPPWRTGRPLPTGG